MAGDVGGSQLGGAVAGQGKGFVNFGGSRFAFFYQAVVDVVALVVSRRGAFHTQGSFGVGDVVEDVHQLLEVLHGEGNGNGFVAGVVVLNGFGADGTQIGNQLVGRIPIGVRLLCLYQSGEEGVCTRIVARFAQMLRHEMDVRTGSLGAVHRILHVREKQVFGNIRLQRIVGVFVDVQPVGAGSEQQSRQYNHIRQYSFHILIVF
ncbi:hypothetical protein Barb6_02277 [Bacteroidales bacterium Barb6]|nr:hypothetical protein Barb6_02277 [Bacteroidales bacterium Barb6]